MNDHIQLPYDFQEVMLKEKAADRNNNDNYNNDINHSSYERILNNGQRRKYSVEEQKRIIRIYDAINNKTKAIKFLQDICGYNEIYVRKIKRWKSPANKPMGRPISQEFEAEVLDEYNKHFPPQTELLRDNLRMCGYLVLNREYFNADSGAMEKKWLKDTRTRNLKFTYKWIKGMLKRNESSALVATATAAVERMT